MADWSSLPSDLVRRIADCLLATNDLDWYMDFRAVCPSWRSATDDPTDSSDLRFRPGNWIIIDEVVQNDERLMVNTATGRVLRKDLPLLRQYYLVTVTTNGAYFVLADREHPHAARVLNPFTGHMIRFAAAVPYNMEVTSAAFSCGSSPKLRLLWESDVCDLHGYSNLYTADPDSECFTAYEAEYSGMLKRLAVVGGTFKEGELLDPVAPLQVAMAERINDAVKLPDHYVEFYQMVFPAVQISGSTEHVSFRKDDLLESAGELILFSKLQNHLKIFRLNTDRIVLEPLEGIGNRAFFFGRHRYISVCADKFPSIDANCIYHVKSTYLSLKIYKYDLEDKKIELVSEAIDSLNPNTLSVDNSPFTILQLLSSYTNNIRTSQLTRRTQASQPVSLRQINQSSRTHQARNQEAGENN
ncbi:hypothetical protein QYE76_058961 [Lolium multiflorum]|uniref:KIB1-4 beta-propeller domain-containing protein n=1 Tax=Lolium multiflorum TaxID=4521 RepID=A0AAD8T6H9_LOLMU|nr:hypothetical protein QYE76_058961 [Lolium multiflorum]